MRILFTGTNDSLPRHIAAQVGDIDPDWRIAHADDGAQALAAMAVEPADAVVVAPVLADMPPAMLLETLRERHPAATRIAVVAPGPGGDGAHSPLMGAAHRFLPAPVAAETLMDAIGSLEELRELLESPSLGERIGRVGKLPSPPHMYLRLTRMLEDDANHGLGEIAEIITSDPAIAARVLQLSNSAFFSSGRQINDLRAAVNRLGTATLRHMVLTSEVFAASGISAAQGAALQQRAVFASRLAAQLLPESSAGLGATAALLADIGLLLPGIRNVRLEPQAEDDDPRLAHTEAGAWLLGLWGLSMPIIEAVAFQLHPARSSSNSFWVTGAVHVATALANDTPVDEAYLDSVGMLFKLEGWRAKAQELADTIEA